ncbi:MAG: DUF6155 family protein [Saprospiraceae bacterium]
MGFTDVKKELNKLEKGKLIALIADLYKKNKSVKQFFDFYANPNEKELFEKYRDKIFYSFYPERGYQLKLKDAKQAIADFKKFGTSADLLAELILFYVETGVMFTNDIGDINEGFYNSLSVTYLNALTLMRKENLLEKFGIRAYKVVSDTTGIGWGFHDHLGDLYFSFYPEHIDDEKEKQQIREKGKIIKLGRQQ